MSLAVLALPASAESSTTPEPDGLPGNGEEVTVARATWDTGWFQAEVIAQLLRRLGYRVDGPLTAENAEFYESVATADGTYDLWVNGWFPLHDNLIDATPDPDAVVPIGLEVDGGALQGYAIDAATAERLGIDDLGDLADPEIAAEFDLDADGLADLIGCNVEWACAPVVEHHLDEYGLHDTVEQVQGDYGPLMSGVAERFAAGAPVLYYTFTPNWTTGALVPGQDVNWVPVPYASLPDDSQTDDDAVANVTGCLDDPCEMGFPANDIRSVASRGFLDEHPSIERLLDEFAIPLADISAQNARMVSNQEHANDIELHAEEWIDANDNLVDEWLTAAIDAHVAAGFRLYPAPSEDGTDETAAPVGPVAVVSRLSPPFVTYDDGSYSGFSIELWELIADGLGAQSEITAVNSSAKVVDEVLRGEAAVGVAAIGMTPSVEESADFSHPYIETGLQVMVSDESDGGVFGGTFGAVLRTIFSRELFSLFAFLVVALLVAAHVIWLTERGKNPAFPESYVAGIKESIWWAVVTATTVGYGDKVPKGTAGRLVSMFWMFAGLILLAYFTAGIATAFTIEEIEGSITGPDDLPGHVVAVQTGSVAESFLDRSGVTTQGFQSEDESYDALIDGEVDAVVHDAAILQHFVSNDGAGLASVVGVPFHQQRYGFVVDFEDPLRERINVELLNLVDTGEYAVLYERWFGRPPGEAGLR